MGKEENSVSNKSKSKKGLPIKATFPYKIETIVAYYFHSQIKYILPFKYINRVTTYDDNLLNNDDDDNQ